MMDFYEAMIEGIEPPAVSYESVVLTMLNSLDTGNEMLEYLDSIVRSK